MAFVYSALTLGSGYDTLVGSTIQEFVTMSNASNSTANQQLPKPVALGLTPSFGFGDRLGLATPGHLESLIKEGGPIKGIFAQQSIREMARTKRNPAQVMTAAAQTLKDARYTDVWGSDADHLKTPADADVPAAVGFTFYTIDPSDHVEVDGGPSAGAVEIDHVNDPRAALDPAPGRIDRVGVVLRFPLVVALQEPHGPAATDVDRRVEGQHGTVRAVAIAAKLPSIARPAPLDFSGWNCVP